jgi:hypothetical protein
MAQNPHEGFSTDEALRRIKAERTLHEETEFGGTMQEPQLPPASAVLHRAVEIPAAAPPPAAPTAPTNQPALSSLGTNVTNLGIFSVSGALASLDPNVQIPAAFAQGCLSLYSIFAPGSSVVDKVTHGAQTVLAFGLAALNISMLYTHDTCTDNPPTANLCIGKTVLTLLYAGLLTASTAAAYKAPTAATPAA